ncbi:MAG: ABC transporter substrate-binding protein [Vicinamibacterales bacterium]
MRVALVLLASTTLACGGRSASDPNALVVGIGSAPNDLDPRFGTDDASDRMQRLIFDNFMELDDHLRVVPKLAESLEHPDPLTYVARVRRGVRFHDGHTLTAADVAFTFGQLIDPAFVSPRKGGYQQLESVTATDEYTVVFRLRQPFASFPINLMMPIVERGASAALRDHPIGTGPYRFQRYLVDDRIELQANSDYWDGAPKNTSLVVRIVPDDVMRGLELRKGSLDLVVNDTAPDIVSQMRADTRLQVVESPGVDYQYMGVNTRDRYLSDRRVRQAIASAIDRESIVTYLRRGLATPAAGMLPELSWAALPYEDVFPYDPARARSLLDEAGYVDPDGAGPQPRFTLTLKVSNNEFNRLQSTVIQENLRAVGIDLDVRTYEFATLYADVISGNFQLFTLQWTSGALADPDILRRVFHCEQAPPIGFNRGRYCNPDVDRAFNLADTTEDPDVRRQIYADVQRLLATDVPYVSLWHKTNVAVGQRDLTGIAMSPTADFSFLRGVGRGAARH